MRLGLVGGAWLGFEVRVRVRVSDICMNRSAKKSERIALQTSESLERSLSVLVHLNSVQKPHLLLSSDRVSKP